MTHWRSVPIFLFLFISILFGSYRANAQSCSVTVSGTVNWSTASWSCVGGASAPTTSGQLFTGDINITINNGGKLVVDIPITIDGDVNITTSGSSAEIEVPSGVTFDINGDFDAADENNMTITVDGTMQVSGILEVKNSNAFGGGGIISGNSIIVKNNNGCSAGGCPDLYFSSCQDGNNNFCDDNVNIATLDLDLGLLEYSIADGSLMWHVFEPFSLTRHEVQYSTDGYVWTWFKELRKYSDEAILLKVDVVERGYYRVVSEDYELESGVSNIVAITDASPSGRELKNISSLPVSIHKNSLGIHIINHVDRPVTITFFSLTGTQLERSILPELSKLDFPITAQYSPVIVSVESTLGSVRTIVFP